MKGLNKFSRTLSVTKKFSLKRQSRKVELIITNVYLIYRCQVQELIHYINLKNLVLFQAI